ncbi:MAG: M14 family metallopeptidase [Gammaproteobacteria bacterium]|nr:M14 family metallopeptidase [Gammaproteobacteria bacterium]
MFTEIDKLPNGFLSCKVEHLHDILQKPTLIHLQGEIEQPLFISTLLHGNETTGFYALQNLLQEYKDQKLPRSLSIFIGNTEAAVTSQRRLERQIDYNRIWPGTHEHYLAEAHMMQQITDIMRELKPFASIDIHNNTGRNPHYGCINALDNRYLSLAGMFSNTVVYFTSPKGVQSAAFAEFCPAVTLECGQSGEVDGVLHATRYLQRVINLQQLPTEPPQHINLYHTVARVMIPEGYSFGFADDATINLYPEIEMYNFCELKPGTAFAWVEPESSGYLETYDENEHETGREYFIYNDQHEIVLRKPVMPSMLTVNTTAIRQDCLCYLMEKISIPSSDT